MRARARIAAKPRPGCGPPSRRPSSRCQTARSAASAAQHISFPRRIFLRPGCRVAVSLSPPHSPLHLPALRRARAQILGVSCSPGPEMRGRRSAGRRPTCQSSRSVSARPHACGRARPAQPGRPPLGAPPWRCRPRPLSRSGIAAGSGREAARGQAPSCLAAEPGLFVPAVTSRGRRHVPAPPSTGSSPETRPHERGWQIRYFIFVT